MLDVEHPVIFFASKARVALFRLPMMFHYFNFARCKMNFKIAVENFYLASVFLFIVFSIVSARCGTRWYKIFENDPQGETLYGQIDDLRDSIIHGAEIRVSVGHYITTVQNAGVIDGNVCAQALFHISKSSFDKFQVICFYVTTF